MKFSEYWKKNLKYPNYQFSKIMDMRKMIGAVIFVIVFILFVLIGLAGIHIPIGDWIIQEYITDLAQTDYASMAEGIINGVIYGLIVWIIFSIIMTINKKTKRPKEVIVKVEQKPEPTAKKEERIISTSKALMDIEEIQGIGSTYGKKLKDQGIMTTDGLLSSGSTPTTRKQLAEKTEISEKLILEWVNIADLLRINGVGQDYSDLLKEAGVNTVVELGRRNANNLHEKLIEINEKKLLVKKMPSINQVSEWIEQAKNLPRKVEY